ncbi:uncharacterized protein LJ264_008649 [Porphyrio hochstetteri]
MGSEMNSSLCIFIYFFLTSAYELKLVGAKINISKEETEGDSACCGADDLDEESQRARFGKDLKLQGLKQGLAEKSANLRLNEELLQAREAAFNLNSKDLQREPG